MSAPLSERHAGCATPRVLVLFFTDPVSFSYLSQRPHKGESALKVQKKKKKTTEKKFWSINHGTQLNQSWLYVVFSTERNTICA